MDTKKHFNNIATTYEELRPVYLPLMDKLADVLEMKEGDVVVDYGCGPGHDLHYLEHKCKIKPIGIDASKEMCSIASEKIGVENIINGDSQYSIQNLNFDKIYFKFVMHHIQQPFQFIDDIISYLKTGCSFAIITMLPANVSSYVVLRYFPALQQIFEREAKRQLEIIEHIRFNPSIQFNILEHDINEEIIDKSLIDKIQNNYSSFISTLSEKEKKDGIKKLKKEIINNHGNKHLTRGVIYHGRKQ